MLKVENVLLQNVSDCTGRTAFVNYSDEADLSEEEALKKG